MTIDQVVYAYIAAEEFYPNAAVIMQEGIKNDCIYVVLEGTVKIKKNISQGQVTLATLNEGAFLGEMAFLDTGKGIRSVSAVAADGSVRLGLLDTQRLIRDYESVSPRVKSLIKALSKRLQAANDKVCDIVVKAK